MSKTVTYSAASREGKTLLALRAGPMTNGELYERFPSGHLVSALAKAGLAESCDDGWRITDAGRAACPLRNPAVAMIRKPTPARLVRSALPIGLPAKTAPQTSVQHTEKPIHTGENRMPTAARSTNQTAVNQVLGLLIDAPEGVQRKDIIKRTRLSDAAVDNAIVNLIKTGKAMRKAYGVIAPVSDGANAIAAHLARSGATAAAAGAPASAATAALVGPDDPCQAMPEIDFMIHEDSRLTIWYGDEIFVLPPDATRRLCRFLDHIEPLPWSPQLDRASAAQPLAA